MRKGDVMRARDFRQAARDVLRGRWFIAIVAAALAMMLGGVNGSSFSFTFDIPIPDEEMTPDNIESVAATIREGNIGALVPILIGLGAILAFSLVISLVIGSAVSIGYSKFNLNLVDGAEPEIKTLFAHFRQVATAIWVRLLVVFRVFIGLCFFIVPGFIIAYKYAMVYFVMAEHPEYTSKEVLRESARIMKGRKWRYFCLWLSFIGWDILAILTFGLGLYFVVPYQQAASAVFYRNAKRMADFYI